MNKQWVLKDVAKQQVEELCKELKINKVLCKLLVQRGITTEEQAQKFFRPTLEKHLYDPFLMKDMGKAVERIDRAINNKEKILIYGDYDVDGTTAVALAYSFFKEMYFFVDYYIPNRYEEGYGISNQGLKYAQENGISLIIALDCGIKAVDKITEAKELGIDFIICDHHRPGEILPPAYAVLDPKRNDCTYPYEELSGCGIGFKLIQAFAQHKYIPFHKVTEHLDLVAVSIAADIVPITDENRVLAYYGLYRLNRKPRPGLRSLIKLNDINRRLTISDIVYVLAPRINAAGRMDDARNAVRLLISQEGSIAKKKANVLQEKNTKRKVIDTSTTNEAFEMAGLKLNGSGEDQKSVVLYKHGWHKGVIGIVASRLLEKHFRPTIVMTKSKDDELVAGSARSVPGYDIYNAIRECSDLLEQFGGHKYAAGLTIKEENVPAFIEMFEKVVADTIEDNMLVPEIEIDSVLPLSEVNSKFYRILQRFAPFGPGNERPVFVSTNVKDSGYSAVVGNNHLKLYAKQDDIKYSVKGIGYNMGDFYTTLKQGPVDVCFYVEENRYNGSTNIQLNIKDLKLHDISELADTDFEEAGEDEEE